MTRSLINRKRIVLGMLAAITGLLIVGAITTGRSADAYDRKFHEWLVAAPCDLAVDLSAPGKWQGRFIQTCGVSHGEPVRLWATGPDEAPIDDIAVLDGLEGSLRIVHADGAVVAESSLPGYPGGVAPPEGAIPLAHLTPFREGEYEVVVQVTSGAPALAGAQQRLTAAYELCGLERLPAQLGELISGGLWVGAILLGVVTGIVAVPRAPRG